MGRTATSALALLVLGSGSSLAFGAVIPPTVSIDAGGQHYDIPVALASDGIKWEIGGETGWQTSNSEFFISFGGLIDPDPQIDFGFSITDFGAPTPFTFNFTTPIILAGGANVVYASISGGLNDVTNNGASITPLLADMDGDTVPELQVNTVSGPGPITNMGVDVGGPMVLPPAGPPGTQTYGPFNSAVQFGPPGPWLTLNSTVSFLASGDGDIFSATGHAEINIPEPGAIGLLALTALGAARRARLIRSISAPTPRVPHFPVRADVDYKAGHSIGSTKSRRQEVHADEWAFLLWQMGVMK